jgi:hypothetical protein
MVDAPIYSLLLAILLFFLFVHVELFYSELTFTPNMKLSVSAASATSKTPGTVSNVSPGPSVASP